MKKKVFIIGLITLSFLIFNYETIKEISSSGLWAFSLNSDKVIITKDYIKPGWLLKGTKGFKLIVEKVNFKKEISLSKLSYSVIHKNIQIKKDSCGTYFGADGMKKIEFEKEYQWTWNTECLGKIKSKERNFGKLINNSWYRFSREAGNGILFHQEDFIYVYIDSDGRIYQFSAALNM